MPQSLSFTNRGSIPKTPGFMAPGFIDRMAKGLGMPGNPQPQQSQIGLLQSHAPTAPVKKMVDSQGNQVHFDTSNSSQKTKGMLGTKKAEASIVPSGQSPAAGSDLQGSAYFENLSKMGNPAEQKAAQNWLSRKNAAPTNTRINNIATPAPGVTTPAASPTATTTPTPAPVVTTPPTTSEQPKGLQVGDQRQNAQNVLDVSGRNALAEGASSAEALYGMLGNQRALQPFAGGATQGLDQSYANLTRPQSTGNLQGETGLFDVQKGILQNAANTRTAQALTSQGLAQTGASTVLGAGTPAQISGSARLYNPLAPLGDNTGQEGIIEGAKNQTIYDLASKYQEGLTNLRAADSLQNQIINTLQSNPTLNTNPVSLLTNLNEFVSGHLGTAPQQLLAQQIKNYLDVLGLDPASVVGIQNQQKGTLAQLLDSLRQTAQSINEANNPTNITSGGTSTPSGGSAGGNMFGSFY